VTRTEAAKRRCVLDDEFAMLPVLSTWTTLFALYLLFAGQATRAELCAGLLAAALGTALRFYLRRAGEYSFRPDAPWGRLVVRVAASLARDTIIVGRALVRASVGRPVRGLAQHQAFMVGGPAAAGRRAVVVLAASIAPNGFVERVATEEQALVLHRLVSTSPREDRLWPV
jgi:hypothetical protein